MIDHALLQALFFGWWTGRAMKNLFSSLFKGHRGRERWPLEKGEKQNNVGEVFLLLFSPPTGLSGPRYEAALCHDVMGRREKQHP